LYDEQSSAVTLTDVIEGGSPVHTVPGAVIANEDTAKTITKLSLTDSHAGTTSLIVTL
jgi:hypothetical protein